MSKYTRYAQDTKTSVDQSRREIEGLLQRYGAAGFGYGWDRREEKNGDVSGLREYATIAFRFGTRHIQLHIPMPVESELGGKRSMKLAQRERWRAVVLVVRAKLEAVRSGISTLDEEFLANVVTKDGRTVGQILIPRMSEAVEAGRLLPEAKPDEEAPWKPA
jgi:hypothetical protein